MNPARLVDWIESRDLPATALTVAVLVLAAVLVWARLDRTKPDENSEDEVQARAKRRRTRVIVGGTAGTIAFIVLLIWGPWWIEDHHLRDKNGDLASSAGIIVTGFRTMLVAIAAGGLTAAGLYYTREKHQLEREQFQHIQEQFAENQRQFERTLRETQDRDERQNQLTREGQVTGRYVEAVKLLASTEPSENLGGIYSLERIMKDSHRDHGAIVDVLAGFAFKSSLNLYENLDESTGFIPAASDPGQTRSIPLPLAVRAAINVIGRNWTPDHGRADLREIRLSYLLLTEIDLSGAELRRADLRGANLREAMLVSTQMVRAKLEESDLQGANLTSAYLKWARLSEARMNETVLEKADLSKANLFGARLRRANMTDTVLDDAYLLEADLRDAVGLTVQRVVRARIYESTKLPEDIAADPAIVARIATCERLRLRNPDPQPAGEDPE
ncbi:pentapeptide repeat-containing protein [Streptomyces triticiradicis]|nr:pentapeptide repeat-containing protein [Streptomyces triticiradicis]